MCYTSIKQRILNSDHRKFVSRHVAKAVVICVALAWLFVSIAVAQSVPSAPGEAVSTDDLIRFQWWAIAGLLGVIGLMGGFVVTHIVVREMTAQKNQIRDLWKRKLDKTTHDTIDHSQLCPACRHLHVSKD